MINYVQKLKTCDREVHIFPQFSIKVFGAFDHNQVSREVYTPGQSAGGNENLFWTNSLIWFLFIIYDF